MWNRLDIAVDTPATSILTANIASLLLQLL